MLQATITNTKPALAALDALTETSLGNKESTPNHFSLP